eukprot:TRINITY_DN14974_c0_g1_i5.p1 TRINITY_DN14974_c0_g1~~TRINITY_DN14974_c0_g1_i5.p1  ORF type:complete len:727 (-),score=211.73 TRINITY_DN14974_c0_g1_i5:113-2293(-)
MLRSLVGSEMCIRDRQERLLEAKRQAKERFAAHLKEEQNRMKSEARERFKAHLKAEEKKSAKKSFEGFLNQESVQIEEGHRLDRRDEYVRCWVRTKNFLLEHDLRELEERVARLAEFELGSAALHEELPALEEELGFKMLATMHLLERSYVETCIADAGHDDLSVDVVLQAFAESQDPPWDTNNLGGHVEQRINALRAAWCSYVPKHASHFLLLQDGLHDWRGGLEALLEEAESHDVAPAKLLQDFLEFLDRVKRKLRVSVDPAQISNFLTDLGLTEGEAREGLPSVMQAVCEAQTPAWDPSHIDEDIHTAFLAYKSRWAPLCAHAILREQEVHQVWIEKDLHSLFRKMTDEGATVSSLDPALRAQIEMIPKLADRQRFYEAGRYDAPKSKFKFGVNNLAAVREQHIQCAVMKFETDDGLCYWLPLAPADRPDELEEMPADATVCEDLTTQVRLILAVESLKAYSVLAPDLGNDITIWDTFIQSAGAENSEQFTAMDTATIQAKISECEASSEFVVTELQRLKEEWRMLHHARVDQLGGQESSDQVELPYVVHHKYVSEEGVERETAKMVEETATYFDAEAGRLSEYIQTNHPNLISTLVEFGEFGDAVRALEDCADLMRNQWSQEGVLPKVVEDLTAAMDVLNSEGAEALGDALQGVISYVAPLLPQTGKAGMDMLLQFVTANMSPGWTQETVTPASYPAMKRERLFSEVQNERASTRDSWRSSV